MRSEVVSYVWDILFKTEVVIILIATAVLSLYAAYDNNSGRPPSLLLTVRRTAQRYFHRLLIALKGSSRKTENRLISKNRTESVRSTDDAVRSAEWQIDVVVNKFGCPAIATLSGSVHGTTVVNGIEVSDPFSCLEDSESPQTRNFLKLQQSISSDYFDGAELKAVQQKFLSRYLAAQSFESIENPINMGGTYFFFKRLRPELPQYSLFATKDLNVEARLVFDPNTLRLPRDADVESSSNDDPSVGMVAVHGTWISVDGFRIAYGYSTNAASREMSIGIRDLVSGKDLADTIVGCAVDYTSIAWIESRTGFFYTLPTLLSADSSGGAPKYSHRVMFHRLQTSQKLDIAVFETQTLTDCLAINVQITSDGHYLLLELFSRNHSTSSAAAFGSVCQENTSHFHVGNKVFYFDLSKFDGVHVASLGPCVRLIDTFQHRFDYISNIEDEFWFRTNFKAPNFRVVRLTLPELTIEDKELDGEAGEAVRMKREAYKCLQAWKSCLDWIPQRLDGVFLESGTIAAHTVLVLKYAKAASHEVLLYDLTQDLVAESQIPVADLPHPAHGTISGPNCNFYSSEIFYQYSDLSDPSSIYRALIDRDPYSGAIEISFSQVNSTEIPGIDKYKFDIKQAFVESSNNLLVPITKFALRSVLDIESDSDSGSDDDRAGLEPIQNGAGGGGQRDAVRSLRREVASTLPIRRSPRPCIICVNSGFGISITPLFSLPFALFAYHCQGLVVIANLQGSGVYGKEWAEKGSKNSKEDVVVDLLNVIQYLVSHKYTTFGQIALYGGTHNGAIIGAAIARSPMMFNAAVVEDGLFDLLKAQRWNPPVSAENGLVRASLAKEALSRSLWSKEFGCSDSQDEMLRLFELSPIHSLVRLPASTQVTTYPAVLCISDGFCRGENLGMVSHIHSLRFIAQLQLVLPGFDCKRKPMLLYAEDQEDSNLDNFQTLSEPSLYETAAKFAFIIKNINASWSD